MEHSETGRGIQRKNTTRAIALRSDYLEIDKKRYAGRIQPSISVKAPWAGMTIWRGVILNRRDVDYLLVFKNQGLPDYSDRHPGHSRVGHS